MHAKKVHEQRVVHFEEMAADNRSIVTTISCQKRSADEGVTYARAHGKIDCQNTTPTSVNIDGCRRCRDWRRRSVRFARFDWVGSYVAVSARAMAALTIVTSPTISTWVGKGGIYPTIASMMAAWSTMSSTEVCWMGNCKLRTSKSFACELLAQEFYK